MRDIIINAPCNIIITQGVEKVKTSQTIWEERNEKFREHKLISAQIARRLRALGDIYERRADRMAHCSDVLEYKYCTDCDKLQVVRANLCRDRFCSVCQWRLALQRYAAMSRILDGIGNGYPEASYSLVTLTVRNCAPAELAKTVERINAAWHLCSNQRHIKSIIMGYAKSLELTYNRRTRTLHPHAHIIIMWADKEAQAHAGALVEAWLRACDKHSLTANIAAQNAQEIQAEEGDSLRGAILETYKYAVKSKEVISMPQDVMAEVVKQWANKRLVSYGGKIKEYAKLTEAECDVITDDNLEIDVSPCRCCGGVNTQNIIYRWAFGKYILANDFKKISLTEK